MKIITTKNYLLWIDELAEIKNDDICVDSEGKIFKHESHFPISIGQRKIIAYYPLTKEAKELDLPLLPNPFEADYEKIYVLLADGDGTMRSIDEPFGVAVKTKEAAEQYLKDGGVGYSHSYTELRVFNTAKEGIDWKYRKIQPAKSHSKQFSLEDIKEAFDSARQKGTGKPYSHEDDTYETVEDYLKELSTQKLPKEFIIPYGLPFITNSEGKEELVGTYKY